MGSCFSSAAHDPADPSSAHPPVTASIISLDGRLREYSLPFTVSDLLLHETSSSSSSSFFVCNSDSLSYDEFVPALDADEQLQPGQIYFVLPSAKLQHRFTASDMADLAVRASIALDGAGKDRPPRRKKARVSPVLKTTAGASDGDFGGKEAEEKKRAKPAPPQIFKSGSSMKKLQKYSSRRAKLAVRSFRFGLNTIYEGVVLDLR